MAATIRRLGANVAIVDDGRHGEPCFAYRDVEGTSSPSSPDDTWKVVGPEKVTHSFRTGAGATWTVMTSGFNPWFIADRAYKVVSITGRHEAQGTGVTFEVKKVANGTAANGSAVVVHSGTYNGAAADYTNQSLTILTTAAGKLTAGDMVYVDFDGTDAAVPLIALTIVLVPDAAETISTS